MASHARQMLCPSCVDIDNFLQAPQGATSRYSQDTQFKLHTWNQADEWSPRCPLCNLFRVASGYSKGTSRPPYALRVVARSLLNAHEWGTPEVEDIVVRRDRQRGEVDREALRKTELGMLFLTITPDHEKDSCSTAELTTDVRRHGLISWRYNYDQYSNSGRGSFLDPANADLALVRTWIDYCDANHRQCAIGTTRGTVEDFQVIDCESGVIIPAPHSLRYVALSYVWGKSSSTSGALLNGKLIVDRLPKTVADAILATKCLGLRYLWVDRYCIPDDPRIKHSQISRMDIIYQNALATLIAVGGSDASYGLPGVGGRQRERQTSANLGSLTLFSTFPHPATLINKSSWMTRGWTYQEAILSRRRIFFTDQQVYFECNSMQCFESLPPQLSEWHTPDKSSFLGLVDRSLFTVPTKQAGLNALRVFNSAYMARELSFDMDSLNAFLGILAYFESLNPSIRHWWGVPFMLQLDDQSRPYTEDYNEFTKPRAERSAPFQEALLPGGRDLVHRSRPSVRPWSSEHCFLNALLWCHNGSGHKRRSDFPSWSWAGWKGRMSPLSLDCGYYGCNCSPGSSAKITGTVMTYGTMTPWHDLFPTLSTKRRQPTHQPREIVIKAKMFQVSVAEVMGPLQEGFVKPGYYIVKKLGRAPLRYGCLDDCTVYAPIKFSEKYNEVEIDRLQQGMGLAGLVLGCGDNLGALVVKPISGGKCERVGVINIRKQTTFVGDLAELKLVEGTENSQLWHSWFDSSGLHGANCSVFDIGKRIAASPSDTTIADWGLRTSEIQIVLA